MAKITLSDGKVINFQPDEIELINDGSNNIKLKDGTTIKINKENFNKLNTYKLSKNNKDKVDDNYSISKIDYNIIDNKARLLLDNSGIVDNIYSVKPQKGMIYIREFEKIKKDYEDYNKYSGQKRINAGTELEKNLDKLYKQLGEENDFVNRFKNIYNVAEKQGDKTTLEELDGQVEFINKFYKEVLPSYGKEYLKNNKEDKKTLNITNLKNNKKELEEGMNAIIPEYEDTKDNIENKDTKVTIEPKQEKEKYADREILKNKDGTYSYISKLDGKIAKLDGKEKKFNSIEEVKKDINTGVAGFNNYKGEKAKIINTQIEDEIKKLGITDPKKQEEFKKTKFAQLNQNKSLKDKGFKESDFKDTDTFTAFKDINFDNIIG